MDRDKNTTFGRCIPSVKEVYGTKHCGKSTSYRHTPEKWKLLITILVMFIIKCKIKQHQTTQLLC